MRWGAAAEVADKDKSWHDLALRKKPNTNGVEVAGEKQMTLGPYRYAVALTVIDEEGQGVTNLFSQHRTKAAALRGWKSGKREANWLYEDEWHFVECCFWDEKIGSTGWFKEDDYFVYSVDQIGECEICQQRERPCYGRYADGRCKNIVNAAKGPWRVYALVDPVDERTRYIGSTERPLQTRLVQHICSSTGVKGRWIADLIEKGLKPIVKQVAEFSTWKEALQHEYHLINTLPDLINRQKTHRVAGQDISADSTL